MIHLCADSCRQSTAHTIEPSFQGTFEAQSEARVVLTASRDGSNDKNAATSAIRRALPRLMFETECITDRTAVAADVGKNVHAVLLAFDAACERCVQEELLKFKVYCSGPRA